jgi:helicase
MIPDLPEELRIVATENNVFRLRRSGLEIGELFEQYSNAAQVVLGYFQNVTEDRLHLLYDTKVASPLIAAGRILDADSAEQFANLSPDRDGKYDDDALQSAISTGLLAMLGHSFYGNFPASTTIAKRFVGFESNLTEFQICSICCASPESIGHFLQYVTEGYPPHQFLEMLETFLVTGDKTRQDRLQAAFLDLNAICDTAFDRAVWLNTRITLAHLIKLSVARLLPEILGPSSLKYIPLFAKTGIKAFLPPQYLAICNSKLVESGANGVLCLPTSSGKTLLSELCILAAVKSKGRIGVFVVPYVALGRQIAERVAKHLPPDWKVIRLFGGFKDPGLSTELNHKLFIVATPERLDAFLRYSDDPFSRIDCLIFDEAHQIENGVRGARMEGLIARVRLAQAKHKLRLVLVSAVVPNSNDMANWVSAEDETTVNHQWSPNCRRISVWTSNEKLIWCHSNDAVSPASTVPNRVIASIDLPWPNKINVFKYDYGEERYFRDANFENLAYLCEYMYLREKEPVLCVCPARETSRQIAMRLSRRFADLEIIPEGIQEALNLIATKYTYYPHLRRTLQRGVAYHNASLPHDLRGAIEDAARNKELKCIASTTTLAEGIDLPFRVTVIADWVHYKGKDNAKVPYSPLLVRNISGRCGRVGYYTEGDIVIYDNPLGPKQYKGPGAKAQWQKRVFFSEGDTGVQSVLQDDFDDESVQAAVASQFLAAIAENPEVDGIEGDFVQNHFAAALSKQPKLLPYIRAIAEDLQNPIQQFAVRNSPLSLTPLGVAVNQTGFAPSSCRKILNVLSDLPAVNTPSALAVHLLTQLGDLPEQGDEKFAKLIVRERYNSLPVRGRAMSPPKTPIRIEGLESVVAAWLQGVQPIDIFASLPTVLKSKKKPPFQEWRQGKDEGTDWDAEFDKFCDFLRTTIFEFLPWLLRACSLLGPHSDLVQPIDWNEIAEQFQRESIITQKADE